MKILAVETSAVAASAALCDGGEVLGEFFTHTKMTHSETLMPMVAGLLKSCKTSFPEIGLYAVSAGPGSFTGVRIGISAVKGMAVVRGTPCAAVSSLEAIAFGAPRFDGIVCAVMDARCGQVYNALFAGGPGGSKRLTPDRALKIDELKKELGQIAKNVILVGDGAKICYNSMNDCGRVFLAPENALYQRASSVGLLALGMAGEGRIVAASQLRPVYLRLPQAERELRARLAQKQPG